MSILPDRINWQLLVIKTSKRDESKLPAIS